MTDMEIRAAGGIALMGALRIADTAGDDILVRRIHNEIERRACIARHPAGKHMATA